MDSSQLVQLALILVLISFLFRRRRVPYPPGPPGLPFLGVAREHPQAEFWKTYAQWGRQYGQYFSSPKLSYS